MENEREVYKYTVEFTQTVVVEAEDAVEAVCKAAYESEGMPRDVYVEGNYYDRL